MVNVFIKGVKDGAYKKARKLAIDQDETIGEVITEAIEKLVEEKSRFENPVEKTFGMLGPASAKSIKREQERFRDIRKEISRGFEKRRKFHERLRYFGPD